MDKLRWGMSQNQLVELFRIGQKDGCHVYITNFGAAVVSVWTPDKKGNFGDIVLGYENLQGYEECTESLGVVVGRHANRLGGASFSIDEEVFTLVANDGVNHIHGGVKGFGKVVWDAEFIQGREQKALELSYLSPHGEEGYPGNLQVRVVYDLTKDGKLWIDYWACSDRDTIVNLTNHSYFNLAGQGSILDHQLLIEADFYTPIDEQSLPTGEIRKVEATPFDFRRLKRIGSGIEGDHEQLKFGSGYDHNWVLRDQGQLKKAARVEHQASGRALEVYTTKPGIQFYSGNFLGGFAGKDGIKYENRSGFCLEAQYFPNSIAYPHFPQALLRAGDLYTHSTVYHFTLIK